MNVDDEDNNIDGDANNFLPGSDDSDGEFELGHEATGSSPLALSGGTNKSIGISNNPHKMSLFATNSPTTGTCSANPAGTPNPKSPPPKCPSALRTSCFTPVVNNGVPTIDDAVDDDPDFFEGTNQDGSREGPHFISVSFIKDKTKIRDQLLKALADTVNIICNNLPNALIHCIKKEVKLPPLSSTTGNNFPSSRMQARQYMFIQNDWSLTPGIRNKPKLPAPKVGKDSRQVFDENRGYDGPNQITAIMWISASCNVKDALTCLQVELEGEKIQIRSKPTQKKNTRNQIVIYGLPPGFNAKGIMRELLFGLKECEKELCNANRFTPFQNME